MIRFAARATHSAGSIEHGAGEPPGAPFVSPSSLRGIGARRPEPVFPRPCIESSANPAPAGWCEGSEVVRRCTGPSKEVSLEAEKRGLGERCPGAKIRGRGGRFLLTSDRFGAATLDSCLGRARPAKESTLDAGPVFYEGTTPPLPGNVRGFIVFAAPERPPYANARRNFPNPGARF